MHEYDAKLEKQLSNVSDMATKTKEQPIMVLEEGSETDVCHSIKQGISLSK